jgi:D-lactate dehydrogenase
MRVAVFNTKPYDKTFLSIANAGKHELFFLEPHLDASTAKLAQGCNAVCAFVNDTLDAPTLEQLAALGVRLVALRCAGYNQVDLPVAKKLGLVVARVPAYSPHAVAEHALALLLSLNRRIHKAYSRVRDGNFALDGLLGFDLHGKTIGVVGTGKIGAIFAKLLHGFGTRILAFDVRPNPELRFAEYVSLETLFAGSHVISLHCPLTPDTYHLVNAERLAKMQFGAMLINTSRGGLVDTPAVIEALKNGQLGALALDVYEEEADLFFENLSSRVIQDDVFSRLLTFPNVLITGHQAFFTQEALENIASTTIANISAFETGNPAIHLV